MRSSARLLAAFGAVVALGGGLVGCGSGSSSGAAPVAVVGSSIAVSGSSVWVVSPDDHAVDRLDSGRLTRIRRVPVDGVPVRLLAGDDGVWVTSGSRGVVWRVSGGGSVSSVAVPCGSTGSLTAWPAGRARFLAVGCPVDDRVVVIDVARSAVRGWLAAPSHPAAVMAAGSSLVAAGRHGDLRSWSVSGVEAAAGRAGAAHELAVTGTDTSVWRPKGRSVSELSSLTSTPAGAVAAYQVVDNERAADPTDPADTGSYASVLRGSARIEPALSGWCPHQFTDLRDRSRAVSGPADAVADPAHGRMWVVGRSTGTLVALDCASEGATVDGVRRATITASADVGVGTSGLALSADGRTAWVDSAFDHAVVRLDVGANGQLQVRRARRSLGTTSLSARAQEGRRVFHDATNAHVSPNGTVACASCHEGGGEDGLSWRIATARIDRKYRRTPALWGVGSVGAHPELLHWDGGFTDLSLLSRTTIQELQGGDGLMVDVGAIGLWLKTLAPPPPPADTASSAQIAEGQRVFAAAGCGQCHVGGSGSDGQRHDVIGPSTEADGALTAVRTPRLVGLAGRAPYFHDGRAATLTDVINDNPANRHGRTSQLTPAEITALIAYLRRL